MKMILKKDWNALDGSQSEFVKITIPAGTHEIERIPNPHGYPGSWLVLKGTKIGASENSWRQWMNGVVADNPEHPEFGKPIDWGDWEVKIED